MATGQRITVRFPVLPDGIEAAIVSALQQGVDPDEGWCARSREWGAFFCRAVGETFSNANGESRQAILANAKPGTRAWLLPEPTNPRDPDAVAIYLSTGGGKAAQIGYLPKDNKIKPHADGGTVAVWLARAGARAPGGPLGAVLYAVINWR